MQIQPEELASLRIDRSRHSEPSAGGGVGFFGWVFRLAFVGLLAGGAFVAGGGGGKDFHQVTQLAQQVLQPVPEVELDQAAKEVDAGPSGHLTASGYVISRTKAGLSYKVPGRIAKLLVREGALVKKGQVLALLEDVEQRANLERATAALATAKAALAELEAGSRDQEIQRAEWAVSEAEANNKHSRQTYERYQQLFSKGGISRQQVDQARMSADMTAAQVQSAKQALSLLREGPRREAIATQKARVTEAEAMIKVAQEALDQTILRAPFDGTVIDRNSEVGETLMFSGDSRQPTGLVVFTIADLHDMEAEVDISETNLSQVREGSPAEVVADAYPDKKYAGVVRMIMPRANRQKAIVPVKVKITETDGKLRPDMSCKVSFMSKAQEERKGPPRLMAPARAVTSRDGKQVVFTVQGGIARMLPVEVGPAEGDRVPVLKGLSGGEDLVVSSLAEIADGTKVRIKKPERQS